MTDLSNFYHLNFDQLDSSVIDGDDYLKDIRDGWPESFPHLKLEWLTREKVREPLHELMIELGRMNSADLDGRDVVLQARMRMYLHKLISNNPVNENPVNENPVNENLVNENPVNENLVNENPVNENPVNENLVNENLVNENLVNENLVSGNPNSLVFCPIKRAEIRGANLKIVLDWLRQEPYSSVVVMSLVLGRTVPGTRKILNQFVKAGWLVRDEVKWIGSTRDIHLFGVSSKGLYYMLDADDIEPEPLRDFKRGRVVQSTGSHVLNIQLARLYFQKLNNPSGQFRKYQAARDMPKFKAKAKVDRWSTYPDFLIHHSHLSPDGDYPVRVAVEIEQHHKGGKRYKELIQAHLRNMEKINPDDNLPRYEYVIYMLEDSHVRDGFKIAFHKHIEEICKTPKSDKSKVIKRDPEVTKKMFIFDTYGDLEKRIRAIS